MSDPKCARALLGAAVGFFRPLAVFTPYAVWFRYEGLEPGHEPIDRPAALAMTRAQLMTLPGGPAAKIGIRYEMWWTVLE